jgi:hypothetical protein
MGVTVHYTLITRDPATVIRALDEFLSGRGEDG